MEIRSPTKKDVAIADPVPNAATKAAYERALVKAAASMAASYEYWLSSVYKRVVKSQQAAGTITEPAAALAEYGADAERPTGKNAPALFAELARLDDYWVRRFKKFALDTAGRVAKDWLRDNTVAWQSKLKRKGFAVKFQLTKQQKTILQVKIKENVSLIKSIQQQYHTDVTGIVSRGFLAGRDLKVMSDELKAKHSVTTRRAAFIARDQANKATAQMNAARQEELGITRAVWVHSSAGKEPRPDHVRAGRERWEFDPRVGIDFGDGFGFVLGGQAIGCRCSSRSIIPAIGRGNDARYDLADVGPKFKGVLQPLTPAKK